MKPFEWARAVARDPTLPSRARHVAAWLALHSHSGPPAYSKASLSDLQRWTGIAKRAVVVASLRELAAAGWLAEQKHPIPSAKGGRRYLTTVHYLVAPETDATAAPVDNHPVNSVDTTPDTNMRVVTSGNHPGYLRSPISVTSGNHKKVEGSSKEPVAGRVADHEAAIHDLVARLGDSKKLR